MKKHNRICCVLLCLLLLLCALPLYGAAAQEPVEPARTASLTLRYEHEKTVLADACFDIYRVASVDSEGAFTVLDPFSAYPLDFDDLSQSHLAVLANTLMGYVQRDDVRPTASGVTAADGTLQFEQLETGLYLVVGTQLTADGKTYTAIPFLISLPYTDTATGTWCYGADINPKCTVETLPEKITQKVLKKWTDKGNETKRPQSITVQLLCDGKAYDTVQLSEKNKWSHTWENLEADHVWTVTEVAVKGYKVELTKSGVTFVLNNTYEGTTPPSPPKPPLPQTGLLWWPVPILLGAGLLCLAFGFARRRNRSHD